MDYDTVSWAELRREFTAAFRRSWRLFWGLFFAPFVGTWREAARVYRVYDNDENGKGDHSP
jgi:hypothetical protein